MLSHDMRVWRDWCVCKCHKDKDPVNASICKRLHRISDMGYILFITGRRKTRSHASANNEDEGVGN